MKRLKTIALADNSLLLLYYADDCGITRHRASTIMYSLTLRVRVTTPRNNDEMERRTLQARRCYRRRGKSVFAGIRSACGVRRAVGLADYRWALPRISIVLP